jgi:NAD(P)H-hydrate epimerase
MQNIIISREQAREIDRRSIEEFGIPSIVLMENAGRAIADFFIKQHIKQNIVICAGKGNNGGDGFVVARHLDNNSIGVQVLVFADPDELKGDAKMNYEIACKSKIPITFLNDNHYSDTLNSILSKAEWIVDALFGTGLVGILKNPFDQIIQSINQTTAKIVAIDIPSGLDCDTGEPLGTSIQANHTFTFVAQKLGFTYDKAKKFLGKVHIVDIGTPRILLNAY